MFFNKWKARAYAEREACDNLKLELNEFKARLSALVEFECRSPVMKEILHLKHNRDCKNIKSKYIRMNCDMYEAFRNDFADSMLFDSSRATYPSKIAGLELYLGAGNMEVY